MTEEAKKSTEVKKVVKTVDDKRKVEEPKKKAVKKVVLKAESVVKVKPKKEKTYTLRSEATGDKVFLIRDGKRYWVMNPMSLSKLGFSLGQEQNVPFEELKKFPEGSPIDLTRPGATVKEVEKKIEQEAKEKPKVEEADKPYKVWS